MILRRDFIAGLGGAAAWPLAARAQQPARMRRMGVLMGFDESDPEARSWLSGFVQRLAELGWTDGRNVRMEFRWGAGNLDRMRTSRKNWSICNPTLYFRKRLRRPPHSTGRHRQSRLYL
jgi:putative ABC transport system substrate-binding protein